MRMSNPFRKVPEHRRLTFSLVSSNKFHFSSNSSGDEFQLRLLLNHTEDDYKVSRKTTFMARLIHKKEGKPIDFLKSWRRVLTKDEVNSKFDQTIWPRWKMIHSSLPPQSPDGRLHQVFQKGMHSKKKKTEELNLRWWIKNHQTPPKTQMVLSKFLTLTSVWNLQRHILPGSLMTWADQWTSFDW